MPLGTGIDKGYNILAHLQGKAHKKLRWGRDSWRDVDDFIAT